MSDHSKYLVPRKRASWLWLTAGLLIAAAIGLSIEALHKWDEAEAVRQQVAKLSVPRPAPPKPSRAELDMKARWAALRQERSFRWYPLFSALEGASSEDIELLEFQPEKATGQLILRGEARTVDALFDYVQNLSRQPAFANAVLLRQKKKQRDSMTVITFEIQATLAVSFHEKKSVS
jgi:hypothetical protein